MELKRHSVKFTQVLDNQEGVVSVIHKCVVCRRFEGRFFSPPPAPPLRSESLRHRHSPIQLSLSLGPCMLEERKGRKVTRLWICFFTCVTQAIHLELVISQRLPLF